MMINMAVALNRVLKLIILLTFMRTIKVVNSTVYNVENSGNGYCSFFNNRAPSAQPALRNCTWFKKNSCCLQEEIEVTFSKVKPLKGASVACQKYLNYLMCYICAPNQNLFYQNERLTVCENFCDDFYEACDTAILKGSPIKTLYSNGKQFCLSRRFLVNSINNCFNFDPLLASTSGAGKIHVHLILLLLLNLVAIISRHNIVKCDVNSKYLLKFKKYLKNNLVRPTLSLKQNNGTVCYIFLPCVLLLTTIISRSCAEDVQLHSNNLTSKDLFHWSKLISDDLTNLSKDGLRYEHLENVLGNVDKELVPVNFSKKILEIREKMVNFFTSKNTLLKKIAFKLQELHDTWDSQFSSAKYLSDLPRPVYKNADFLDGFSSEEYSYDMKFRKKVLVNSSAVKVPNSFEKGNKNIIETVEWSASLDEIFVENMNEDPDIRWQYFGSSTGMQRVFPGYESPRNFIGFTEDFDPRSRPWYLSAVSGPKDVVIILDGSASMRENNRLLRATQVVRNLLKSFTKDDRVNIVVSRSSYWDSKGMEYAHSPTVLSCEKNDLIQGTASNVQELRAALQTVSAYGGSDHMAAFATAFKLLENTNEKGVGNCQTLIILVTDGDIRDGQNRCSRGYYQFFHDGTKEFKPGKLCKYLLDNLQSEVKKLQYTLEQQANLVTFLVDELDSSQSTTIPKTLACSHNGVVVDVTNSYDVITQMQPYFTYLLHTTGYNDTIWTSPYLDTGGLGLMMTVSMPVYSSKANSHIGVIGIDVPLEKIEAILTHSTWSESYAFMIDRQDFTAIIHPFARPTAQLRQDPIFAPVWELETHDGKPEDFKEVIQSIKSQGTGSYVIRTDAVRPVSSGISMLWKNVDFTRYLFTDIPGSDFTVVVSTSEEDVSEYFLDIDLADYSGISYLSNMEKYNELESEFPDIYNNLSPNSHWARYANLSVSVSRSVVGLAPRALCDSVSYLYGRPNFTSVHEFINSVGTRSDEGCPEGVYNSRVRSSVRLTHSMEKQWKERDVKLQNQILWTYVGTDTGVMRVYPGVRIKRTFDPTVRRWYTGAINNPENGLSISKIYQDVLPSTGIVVTLSKGIYRDTLTPIPEPSQCTDTTKADGCACVKSIDCESGHCLGNKCTQGVIQAVVAMDIRYSDFHDRVRNLRSQIKNAEGKFRYCGEVYNCQHIDKQLCSTRCYLVTDTGHFSYTEDFKLPEENFPRIENSVYKTLASRHGFIFRNLLNQEIFIRNYRLDYQGVCYVTKDGSKNTREQQWTELHHLEDKDEEPGAIPPFNNEYSCVHETVYYHANTTVLRDKSFITHGELTHDPCAESGSYHFLSIPNVNMFLLVVEDYKEDMKNLNCQIMNSVLSPVTQELEYQVCPTIITGSTITKQELNISIPRLCPYYAHVAVPCGWSAASTIHSTQNAVSFFIYILNYVMFKVIVFFVRILY